MLNSLEKSLYSMLVTKAPFQIPQNGRKAIAKYLPYIGLVVGIFALIAAVAAYNAMMLLSSVALYPGYYTSTVQSAAGAAWAGIILLLVEAVIYFMAFPKLKKGLKSGWNLLFIGALLNVVYAVVLAVMSMDFSGLIINLLSSLVGLYLLFQIRDQYLASQKSVGGSQPTTSDKK